MNRVQRAVKATGDAIGGFGEATGAAITRVVMRFAGRAALWGRLLLPRTKFDYAKEVGDGTRSSVVMACILWIARAWPEAPLRISTKEADGTRSPLVNHPMITLLEFPNPAYSGVLMWMAIVVDFIASGNAYLLKVRSGAGRVVQLWYTPSWMMKPVWPDDGSAYISYYEYQPDKRRKPDFIAPSEVVHFRYGIDPQNTRLGLSPVASVLREVFTDDEAANFTASLLRNLAIPGVVISPEGDTYVTGDDADEIKQNYVNEFGADGRGRPLVMLGPTKVTTIGYSPKDMDYKTLRRVPEERVAAVIGIPPGVVGLGAGLERNTFSNYTESRQAAYESNLIPTQRLIAADLTTQLLPDFDDPLRVVLDHDLNQVRVLRDDLLALFSRHTSAVSGGWMMISEARSAAGLKTSPEHDIFLIPSTLTQVKPADLGKPPEPPPAAIPPANGNPVVREVPPKQLPGARRAKMNENHDEQGRFAEGDSSGGGGGSGGTPSERFAAATGGRVSVSQLTVKAEVRDEVLDTLSSLSGQYPEVVAASAGANVQQIRSISSEKDPVYTIKAGSMAAYSSEYGAVWLNPAFFGGPRSIAAGGKGGWHPASAANLQGTVAHEFGHALERTIQPAELREKVWGFSFDKRATLPAPTKALSKYALTDHHEAFAEAFSWHVMNPGGTPPDKYTASVIDVVKNGARK